MTLQDFPEFFIQPFDLDFFRHLGTRLSLGYPAAAPAVELLETQFRLGEHRFVLVVKPPKIVRKSSQRNIAPAHPPPFEQRYHHDAEHDERGDGSRQRGGVPPREEAQARV